MAWVVDTCLVIDVLDGDPDFGAISAACLDAHAGEGLVLCPISYVELAPAFLGSTQRQHEFLDRAGIAYLEPWTLDDTTQAHRAWHAHVTSRRERKGNRRPVADVLIGAFALRMDGLLTRNISDFKTLFPKLRVTVPRRPG